MKPSRIAVLALGALTVWAFLYFLVFMLFLAGAMASHNLASSPGFIAAFDMVLSLRLSILLIPALLVFYLAYLYSTGTVPSRKKPLWALALASASVVAMPAFWYVHLWRPGRRQA